MKGAVAALALGVNTLVMVVLMVPPALVKLALPLAAVRGACDRVLNAIAERWIANNNLWIGWVCRAPWDVEGVEALERRGWYVVTSNHQSWVDIFVLQRVLGGHMPLLKFFLKRELIYVPVIGLAWWALDFPFVRRKGGVQGSRDDLATTQAACARFRAVPTALLNFVEGTRYTPAKAERQKSPYRHLLKPKAGGMAMALATLGDKLHGLLDVTIVYPQGVPTFWDLLSGKVERVVVRVRQVPFPGALGRPDAASDPGFRGEVQDWVQALWREKDGAIERLLGRG